MADGGRPYDLVLAGATGFAGRLTAAYLAANAPDGLRWAVAGRDEARLAALGLPVPALHVDLGDPASVAALAASARVVATTVGPYLHYGEPLVAACAEAGTDYLDITGEPEFVDRMYLDYHHRAVSTGARLVHCCGFDSMPHDLGALHAVRQLPADRPIRLAGYVRARGALSGGTYRSAITAFSRLRQARAAAAQRRQVEPRPADRRARAVPGRPHRVPGSRLWAAPLPTIDPTIVARSARALQDYGPDFAYSHYAAVRHVLTIAAGAAGLAGLAGLAHIPPARRLLLRHVNAGTGPSAQRRAESWFRVRFVGTAGDRRVVTEVSGGDPGYDATAIMLAEAALCLALDDLPQTSGQVTTAVAMGAPLIDRLQGAGIRFEVLHAGG